MMDTRDTRAALLAEIEETAAMIGRQPSTVARMAGHNGQFYAKLASGEISVTLATVDKLRASLRDMRGAS